MTGIFRSSVLLLAIFGLSIIISTPTNAGQKVNGYLEVLPASQYPNGNPNFEVSDIGGAIFGIRNIFDDGSGNTTTIGNINFSKSLIGTGSTVSNNGIGIMDGGIFGASTSQHGSIAFGTDTAALSNTNAYNGSLAGGDMTGTGNLVQQIIARTGSLDIGYLTNTTVPSSATMEADNGSINVGEINTDGNINGFGNGSAIFGYVANNGLMQIDTSSEGNILAGYSAGHMEIYSAFSGGIGNLVGGYAAAGGFLSATGNGDLVWGYSDGSGASALTAGGQASIALGHNVGATGNESTAIGASFVNSTNNSFAVGYGAKDFSVTSTGATSKNYTINSGGSLTFGDGTFLTTAPSGSSQWLNSGSDIYFNTGNVGIGTAIPQSKLTIGSTGQLKIDGSGNITSTGGNFTAKMAYADGEVLTDANRNLRMATSQGDFYDSAGSAGSNGQLLVSQGGSLAGVKWTTKTIPAPGGAIHDIQLNNGSGGFAGNANFTYDGSSQFYVAGNIGINNTNPQFGVDYIASNGSGGHSYLLSGVDTSGSSTEMHFGTDSGDLFWGLNSTSGGSDVGWAGPGDLAYSLRTGGNIDFGVGGGGANQDFIIGADDSVKTQFNILDNGSGTATFNGLTVGGTNVCEQDGTNCQAKVTSVTAGTGLTGGTITNTGTIALDLTHANTWTGQQIFNTANVGIGSATPGAKLDVAGEIRSSDWASASTGTLLCKKASGGIGFCATLVGVVCSSCN